MSLTGIFLILFLTVHLIGNLQLLKSDGGAAFNIYSEFMGNNTLIQLISKGNFFFIALHTVQGLLLYFQNKGAKASRYAVNPGNASWASRNMALLGTLILAFILMHLGHFWVQFKFFSGSLDQVTIEGASMIDAYGRVVEVLTNPIWLVCYLIGLAVLAFHLSHGFQSAFQTLGLNHKKYTPLIRGLGLGYSIVIPLLFAVIPIFLYINK